MGQTISRPNKKTLMPEVVFYLICKYPEFTNHLSNRCFWRHQAEFPTICGVHGRWTAHNICGYCKHSASNRYLKPENEYKRKLKDETLGRKSELVKINCLMRQHEASQILVLSRMKTKKTYMSVLLGITPVIPENAYIYELIYCHLVGIDFLIEQYIE